MKAIINIEDPVLGSWHQITVESGAGADGMIVRLDGTTIPFTMETSRRAKNLLHAFTDDFAGITGKEEHLLS